MGKLKYKLKEAPQPPAIPGAKVGDIKVDGGIKSTITNIDSETGQISWDVDYIPDVGELVNDVNQLTNTSKDVAVKTKDDPKFRDIYDDAKLLRNKIRTHVRNNYPEEYRKAVGVAEEIVDEISTSAAGGSYLTPYAFRLKGSKPNDKAYKELGYKEVKEGIGATLGLGPKASEDGVKDNAYVKQFKYKLVPKDKNGNYVQKGSGLEVKNLFKEEEGQSPKEFHQERMSGFDRIGDLLGQIQPLLKDAKKETEDYYKKDSKSYAVVYGTDLVVDYLNDILDILKDKEE
tara:strand:- start:1329 stop:2192 length:864 start_codon:yes stop_codon:yes gene_type:complete